MQRSALLPLAQHIRDNGLDPGAMRVMEACCGTGRFHTFLKVGFVWEAMRDTPMHCVIVVIGRISVQHTC
jgi:hypothetical protein